MDLSRSDYIAPRLAWRRIRTTVVFLVAALILAAFGTWLTSAVFQARESARRIACNGHLFYIAIAMHEYHQTYHCYPPAYVADKNGKPMHSWRVLLLPFMGFKDLYDQYRFNESWDSSHNRRVTDVAIESYRCPGQPKAQNALTNYMMVVGTHTISDGPHSRNMAEITDGLRNTIMFVEVADSGTRWAEPRDLNFDQINFKINSSKRQGISGYHTGGVNAVFCAPLVRFLSDSTNPQLIKAMLTIDGGEQVPAEP